MSKYFIATFLVSTTILFLIFSLYTNIQTERNDVSIVIEDSEVPPISLSVAIIGDPHLPEGHKNIEEFKKILFEVKKANPDLIVFVGDYIANPRSIKNMVKHRKSIINSLKVVDPVPRAVILGNYESWSNPDDWLTTFKELGVTVLENDNSNIKRNFFSNTKFNNSFKKSLDGEKQKFSINFVNDQLLLFSIFPFMSFDESLFIVAYEYNSEINEINNK